MKVEITNKGIQIGKHLITHFTGSLYTTIQGLRIRNIYIKKPNIKTRSVTIDLCAGSGWIWYEAKGITVSVCEEGVKQVFGKIPEIIYFN